MSRETCLLKMDYGRQLGKHLEERITEHVRYTSTEREVRPEWGWVRMDGTEKQVEA